MAKSQAFLALLFCFLLIASSGMLMAEAKICSRPSKTWTGPCIKTENCNKQCKNWEEARNGACHRSGIGFACFCYFKC
ncbi:defensin 1 [Olea europaea subsp. europaea]|uniref:Defensin 1 n=1 Tax=Olea europaea subsp. europaea TaxID=158383 RepID=A0A8S0PTA6_OLEEU|nr:defensin 1 [Olea europaea subsp. europaea]